MRRLVLAAFVLTGCVHRIPGTVGDRQRVVSGDRPYCLTGDGTTFYCDYWTAQDCLQDFAYGDVSNKMGLVSPAEVVCAENLSAPSKIAPAPGAENLSSASAGAP